MTEEYSSSSFISKFYSILKNKNFEAIIRYDEPNAKIFILDKEKLEFQVLPNFFRHNKFTSLIRQLNHYGFKKIKDNSILTFTHPSLQNGDKFLEIISRKKAQGLVQKNEEQAKNCTHHRSAYQLPNYNGVEYEQTLVEVNNSRFVAGFSYQDPNSMIQRDNSIPLIPNFNVILAGPQTSYFVNYAFSLQGFYDPNSKFGCFQSMV